MADNTFWWDLPEGRNLADKIIDTVKAIDQTQVEIFERMLRNAALYDPNDRSAYQYGSWTGKNPWSEYPVSGKNVVASNVDTVMAEVASTEPRARFMTEGGDWSQIQRAKAYEAYADGLVKLTGLHAKIQDVFRSGAAVKGLGSIKISANHDTKEIDVWVNPPEEIVVDDGETGGAPARTRYHRRIVSKEQLKALYPDKAVEIDGAQRTTGGNGSGWAYWADIYPLERDQVVVVEAWRLPFGKKDFKGYVPGKHAIVVDTVALFVEEWEKDHFPCADIRWSKRASSFYGISLVERIADIQRRLNKLYWQRDRVIDQFAFPTTWYHRQDAENAVKGVNRAGMVGVYNVEPPKTIIPPAVSPDIAIAIKEGEASAYEETGTNRMTASGQIPAGFESGEAIRQYHDKTSRRFNVQQKYLEDFFLECVVLLLEAAKELGDDAPEVPVKRRKGKRVLKWPDVDMKEIKVQISAASSLAKTPAGQLEFAANLADRGLITPDEYRALLDHPDVGRVLSAYTAAFEDVERCIEEILEGESLVPEPYQNLKMIVWRGQMRYLEALDDGAPEEILEGLRQWIVQAAHLLAPPPAPAQPGMPGVGMPAPDMGTQPGMPQPGAPPVMAPAAPALAPSAPVAVA